MRFSILGGKFEVGGECQCLVVFAELSQRRFIGFCDKDAIHDTIKAQDVDKNEVNF